MFFKAKSAEVSIGLFWLYLVPFSHSGVYFLLLIFKLHARSISMHALILSQIISFRETFCPLHFVPSYLTHSFTKIKSIVWKQTEWERNITMETTSAFKLPRLRFSQVYFQFSFQEDCHRKVPIKSKDSFSTLVNLTPVLSLEHCTFGTKQIKRLFQPPNFLFHKQNIIATLKWQTDRQMGLRRKQQ